MCVQLSRSISLEYTCERMTYTFECTRSLMCWLKCCECQICVQTGTQSECGHWVYYVDRSRNQAFSSLDIFDPASIALRASDVLRMSPLWTNRTIRYECGKRICMAGECKRGSIGRFLYIICTRLCGRCDTLFGANVCTHDWDGKRAIESINLSTVSFEPTTKMEAAEKSCVCVCG